MLNYSESGLLNPYMTQFQWYRAHNVDGLLMYHRAYDSAATRIACRSSLLDHIEYILQNHFVSLKGMYITISDDALIWWNSCLLNDNLESLRIIVP